MYKHTNEKEYKLKGTYLEVKHYYGLLTRKLAIMQTEALGDADFDLLDKYESDIRKFELNITQINESCEITPEKTADIKERRNFDNIVKNYEACKLDFQNDRKAQRQLKLRNELYSSALLELVSDEVFVMDILKNILDGEVESLTYDIVFAMAVLTDFFTFVKENNPLLKSYNGSMTVN